MGPLAQAALSASTLIEAKREVRDEEGTDSRSPAIKSVFKVLVGNGGYVALGFLANVVSANGLSPTGFGLVAIALAVLNVLQEICGNGVDLAMVRLAAPHVESRPERARAYYRAALRYKLFINGGVAIILWLAAPHVANLVFEEARMISLLRWVCVGLLGAALYNYMLSRFQAEERFGLFAILRIASNIAKLAILGLIWLLEVFNPDTVLAAWMAAFFAGYVLALMFVTRDTPTAEAPPARSPEYLSDIIRYSKWLVGSSFLFCLYSRADMLILARYVDSAAIGQYAAAWNITFIIDLVTYSVIIALLPRATSLETGEEFLHYMKHTLIITLALAVMLAPLYFLADLFFAVFFPAYGMSAELFRILLIGALITLLFHPLYLILYTRNVVHWLTLINFCLVVFSVALGLAVIPEFETHGAAWVTVSGRIFAAILILIFVYRELNAAFEAGRSRQRDSH